MISKTEAIKQDLEVKDSHSEEEEIEIKRQAKRTVRVVEDEEEEEDEEMKEEVVTEHQ